MEKEIQEMEEKRMKECLKQLFKKLSEASEECELETLPAITKSMLDIYSVFRTIQF